MKNENTNTNVNPEALNVQELSLEDMEDVAGGGIKEVVAATTLAAMAMTGNTVSAFGLANALAEENAAHIEIAPAQEDYGAEFAGALADEIVAEPAEEVTAAAVDEVVAEADFDLAEESAAELTEEGELTDTEAVEELEDADLGELTGEVDADAALKQIIDEAMDANQNKGIGAALDAAFESVAFAGGDVLDPETGKLAVGEGEVVRVAAEAATARFAGLSTDQVFGAVSVAAVRASNSGLLDALGNGPVLNSMSMSEQELEQTLEYMKSGSKNAIMYTIDQLAKVSSPAFKNMILPLIKAMVGDMFDGLFPQSNEDKVMNKLNQIEQQIKVAEDSIKTHTDNVVVLAAIGDKYGTVRDRAQTLAARVDNIRFNPYLTDEQKVEELAKLYKDGVVYDLETALNGATNAFNGDTEFSLEQKSVFDMAYSTAVEKSMFSQEAIEAATPYLMRQLATYLAGYAALMPVYEAYEQVYGASYLLATREVMAQRLGGVDREGHEMSSTVLQKYENFFGMDKYIFVNKGQTAPVKLNQTMYYMSSRADFREVEKEIKNTALTRAQVESLAKYCKEKNLTLNQFLFEQMGFINPKALPKELEGMIAPAQTTGVVSLLYSRRTHQDVIE